MDALATLGQILNPDKNRRDAIHIPTLRVEAAEPLAPNAHIGLLPDGRASRFAPKLIGVVDPFLNEMVPTGQFCFCLIYPRTVEKFVHFWTHSDVPIRPQELKEFRTNTSVEVVGDQRRVNTDVQLGKLAPKDGVKKDAVHCPVLPVQASESLSPGQDVAFTEDGKLTSCVSNGKKHLGKVDPFLQQRVSANEWCWFFMYPGQIQSLYHDWEQCDVKSDVKLEVKAQETTPVVDDAQSESEPEPVQTEQHYWDYWPPQVDRNDGWNSDC